MDVTCIVKSTFCEDPPLENVPARFIAVRMVICAPDANPVWSENLVKLATKPD